MKDKNRTSKYAAANGATGALRLANTPPWLRRTICLATFVGSIMLAASPAFAATARHSSSSHPLFNDPAAKAYSHNGLPCSTAPVSGSFMSKPDGALRELGQIERANIGSLKNTSDRGNGAKGTLYHPFMRSERQPAINFVYHAPPPRAGGSGRSSARSR